MGRWVCSADDMLMLRSGSVYGVWECDWRGDIGVDLVRIRVRGKAVTWASARNGYA